MGKIYSLANKFLWAGTILLTMSFIFKFLHLKGAEQLLASGSFVFFSALAIKLEKRKIGLGLFLLCIWVLFYRAGQMPLRAEEPRRAVVSMEMAYNNEFIMPTIHNEAYLNKPPIFNWLQVLSFRIFGNFGAFAARFPGLLFLLFTAINVSWFSKKYFARDGFLPGLMVLSCADILFYGSINAGEIDLFYAFISSAQLFTILLSFKKHRQSLLVVSFILMAVGVLTKGLPSLAIQFISLLVLFLFRENRKKFNFLGTIFGLFVGSLILFCFFYSYGKKADAWAYIFNIIGESGQKASHNSSSLFTAFRGILSNTLTLLKLSLPWVLIPIVLKIKKKNLLPSKTHSRLYFILGFNLLIYLISGTLKERYIYPFVPLFSVIIYQLYMCYLPKKWLQFFLFGLIFARFIYNETLLPMQAKELAKDEVYRFAIDILNETEGKPIYFGESMGKEMFFLSFYKKIQTPVPVRYELVYELEKNKKDLVRFKKTPEKGDYFLLFAQKGEEGKIQYHDYWADKSLILKQF